MALIIGDSHARRFVQYVNNGSCITRTQHNKLAVGLCIGGLQINQLRRHLESVGVPRGTHKVLIMVGTNDILKRPILNSRILIRQFKWLIKTLRKCAPDCTIFLCTILPLFKAFVDNNSIEFINSKITTLQQAENKLYIVDLYRHFQQRRHMYQRDGIHLNSDGLLHLRDILETNGVDCNTLFTHTF